MKPTLQPGLTSQVSFDIDRERTIDFMGEAARVYATPMLVRDIEVACRNLLLAAPRRGRRLGRHARRDRPHRRDAAGHAGRA